MKEMVATLKKPRRVMMLVKAGPAVDDFIEMLVSICYQAKAVLTAFRIVSENSEYKLVITDTWPLYPLLFVVDLDLNMLVPLLCKTYAILFIEQLGANGGCVAVSYLSFLWTFCVIGCPRTISL